MKDKWHERFGRAPDLSETGVGHSSEEMAAFESPDGKTILEYHHAVLERAKKYIDNNLSEAELKRRAKSLTLKNTNTVRGRLLGIVSEGFQHVGQAAYVRGLIKGQGPYLDLIDLVWSGREDSNLRPPEPHIARRKDGDRLPPFHQALYSLFRIKSNK
ncbi:DUF664 domain-containing protein [Chloroflexota bacterium]